MIILLNVIGAFLIVFIVWWFWFSETKVKHIEKGNVKIIIKDGVYSPARIEVNANEPITLEFLRKDAAGCSAYVVFDNLDVHVELPLNKSHEVQLGKLSPGNYPFACQMKMYTGELVVK